MRLRSGPRHDHCLFSLPPDNSSTRTVARTFELTYASRSDADPHWRKRGAMTSPRAHRAGEDGANRCRAVPNGRCDVHPFLVTTAAATPTIILTPTRRTRCRRRCTAHATKHRPVKYMIVLLHCRCYRCSQSFERRESKIVEFMKYLVIYFFLREELSLAMI